MTLLIKVIKIIREILIKISPPSKKNICYYPNFKNNLDLSNHYYRALWYFPQQRKKNYEIIFPMAFNLKKNLKKPNYFYKENFPSKHTKFTKFPTTKLKDFLCSDVILTWKEKDTFALKIARKLDIPIVNIETTSKKSIEYGNYPKVIWKYFLTGKERKLEEEKQKKRFSEIHEIIKKKNYKNSFVFGNGPSIQKYTQHEYSKSLCIICNSSVQNKQLLKTTKPYFVTAGDAISHIGVSAYAEQFRKDLFGYIKDNTCYYFGTLELCYFMTLHYPSISNKFILCSQKSKEPILDLNKDFRLPQLSSTMNIHMLPLACTFSDKIYLLGVDGKSENEKKNEDFWPHPKGFQYHDLVETGHLCHPTFHGNRLVNEYNRYIKSIEKSFKHGETERDIKYIPLSSSSIEPIQRRKIINQEKISHTSYLNPESPPTQVI